MVDLYSYWRQRQASERFNLSEFRLRTKRKSIGGANNPTPRKIPLTSLTWDSSTPLISPTKPVRVNREQQQLEDFSFLYDLILPNNTQQYEHSIREKKPLGDSGEELICFELS